MKELSPTVRLVIEKLFPNSQHVEVERLLTTDVVQGRGSDWDALGERVQLAALKVSEQNLVLLRSAVELAHIDWRDLLMAAGFGFSVTEHEKWAAKVLES